MPEKLLLTDATTALSLDDDVALFRALADIATKAPQLALQLKNLPAGQTPARQLASLKGAFAAAGLASDYGTLTADLSKIADASGILPAQYQTLLEPLSSLAGRSKGVITWSISKPAAAAPATLPNYSLDLSGSLQLTFKAVDSWVDPAVTDSLLSVQVTGSVTVSGSAKMVFSPGGSASIGGSASAGLTLTYYFKPDGGEFYGMALADALVNLSDPFDLQAVWNGFAQSALQGVVFKTNGAASVQVQAALADAISLGQGFAADLGVTVGVSAGVAGSFSLSLYKAAVTGGFEIDTVLSREPTTQFDLNGSAGLAIDLSQATKTISQIFASTVTEEQKVLGEIEPFLTPGTWLRGQAETQFASLMKTLVGNTGLQTALIGDFQAALGPNDAPNVSTWFAGVVTGAIDRGSVLLGGDIDAVLKEVAQIAPTVSAAATTDLKALVTEGVSEAQTALKSTVGGLVASEENTLEDALKHAGAPLNAALDQVDAALASVQALLTKADKAFHDAITAAQQALTGKVTAKLTFDDSVATDNMVEVDGSFISVDPAASQFYLDLVTGDLNRMIAVIDGAVASPKNFQLHADKSQVSRFSKIQGSEGLEVAFVGIDLKWSDIVTGEATVLADGVGNVHVNSSGSLSQTFGSTSTSRSVSFVETAALVRAAAQAGSAAAAGPPVLQITIDATYQSTNLTWGNVAAFAGQLADTRLGLVSGAAVTNAQTAFKTWAGSIGAKISGSVTGELRLAGAQITDLLQISNRAADHSLTDQGKLAIINAALTQIPAVDPSEWGDFDKGKNALFNEYPEFKRPTPAEVVLACQACLPDLNAPPLPNGDINVVVTGLTDEGLPNPTAITAYGNFLQYVFGMWQLVYIIDVMGQIYLSSPSVDPEQQPGWSAGQYSQAQSALANDSRYWVNLYDPLVDIMSAKASTWTCVFLRIMADLSGSSDKPAVMLKLTYKPATGDPKTAAFG